VIEHVIAGKIDVGPLDSYVHDLLKRNEPETTVRLRTVESTAMTPIPPLVVSSTVDVLVMTRFAAVKPTDYAVLLSQAREADRQEIPTPALGLP